MNNLYFEDLLEMNKNEILYLHWEGDHKEAERTTVQNILAAIEDQEYTKEDFDLYAYCLTEKEYKQNQ